MRILEYVFSVHKNILTGRIQTCTFFRCCHKQGKQHCCWCRISHHKSIEGWKILGRMFFVGKLRQTGRFHYHIFEDETQLGTVLKRIRNKILSNDSTGKIVSVRKYVWAFSRHLLTSFTSMRLNLCSIWTYITFITLNSRFTNTFSRHLLTIISNGSIWRTITSWKF